MMTKRQKVTAGICLVLLAVLFAGVFFSTRASVSAGYKDISVTVVHQDGSEKVFEYQTDVEYLGELLLGEGLVEGEESEYGLYVQVVDGEEAVYEVDGAYWAFYENGEYAMQGIDLTPVDDEDSFSLVYTYGE